MRKNSPKLILLNFVALLPMVVRIHHHQQRRAILPPQVVTPPDSLIPIPDPAPTPERQRLDERTGGHLYDVSEGLGATQTVGISTDYLGFTHRRSSSYTIIHLHLAQVSITQPNLQWNRTPVVR